jgi:hypothetical protein
MKVRGIQTFVIFDGKLANSEKVGQLRKETKVCTLLLKPRCSSSIFGSEVEIKTLSR